MSFISAVATAGENESNGQVSQGIVTSLLAFCNALSLLLYFLRYSVGRYFVTKKVTRYSNAFTCNALLYNTAYIVPQH